MNVKRMIGLGILTLGLSGVPLVSSAGQERCARADAPRSYNKGISIRSGKTSYRVSKSRAYRNSGSDRHYKTQVVKRWIPGHRIRYRESCGRRVSQWVPGHYDHVEQRVSRSYVRPSNYYKVDHAPTYSHWR